MIDPSCPITNYKIVSAIRNEIASRLDIGFPSGGAGLTLETLSREPSQVHGRCHML